MTEKNVQGGLVGPTFACLIGEQFRDFKKGDRFWYERPDSRIGFTEGKKIYISNVVFFVYQYDLGDLEDFPKHTIFFYSIFYSNFQL